MGQKIVVGPITKGQQTNVLPFYVDNDSFPTLINAYTWRGRVKRKRGTSLLTRLQRYFNSASVSYTNTSTITLTGGNGDILSGFSLSGSVIPTTVTITNPNTMATYTDNGQGALTTGGTINYSTGEITLAAEAGNAVNASFIYYPILPVMGLPSFNSSGTSDNFPINLAFDTQYSYNIPTTSPYTAYDVSFYKNPASTAPYPGSYVAKTNPTPLTWAGQDYQLFWAIGDSNALFATNGVQVPFSSNNIGMQYKMATNISSISATQATFTIDSHGLSVGDFLFFNEFDTTKVTALNFQTGYVTTVVNSNSITVTFPNASLGGSGGTVNGLVQYLTNNSDTTRSCLRFYDGDPTNGSSSSPVLNGSKGWVNFCPPISQAAASIAGLPSAQYYMVGCRMILPFKDRLLFFGPVVQASNNGNSGTQQYLQDVIIYSENGVPYYTASFNGNVDDTVNTTFTPLLTPNASTSSQILGAIPGAFWNDVVGFGGFVQSGLNEPIITAAPNQDVIIIGFQTLKAKLLYTGNDIQPFNFYYVNSEFGDSSTFSSIPLDRGVLTKGTNGFLLTTQTDAQRVDLQIPEAVFQTSLISNGKERVCSQRDYDNEWIYFSYPLNNAPNGTGGVPYRFPTATLQYNYREQSWSTFLETYTSYGTFRKKTGDNWLTVVPMGGSWQSWNTPWNAGQTTLLQTQITAGNQQGFVMIREADTTSEGSSLQINSFSGSNIVSNDHCLNSGDYIIISGCIGTISSQVNGKIFQVQPINGDSNTLTLNPSIGSGTYLGGGTIQRMYIPQIQTRQFPVAWSMGRKTRIGPQQFLFTRTPSGQVQLLMYANQSQQASNQGNIIPSNNVQNASLIYNNILYTCAESTNLGLTAPNVNLQQLSGSMSNQLWHRMNTSLIGDTVQLEITLSPTQMTDPTLSNQFEEIELHGMIIDVTPAGMMC